MIFFYMDIAEKSQIKIYFSPYSHMFLNNAILHIPMILF